MLFCVLPAVAFATEPETVEIPGGDQRLRAAVYRPQGNGPFPVVVGLHGCGGLNGPDKSVEATYRDWAEHLVASGFAVVYPDSYGSRGLGNQCAVRARSVRNDRERVTDVVAVRAWLHGQAWANGGRLSLLGWSSGGITALWAVRPRVAPKDGKADFRAAAVLYPGCRRLSNAAWSTRIPTLLLIGGADDQTRPADCQQMAAGAKGRSARVALQVYPGAHHEFDHPNLKLQVRTGQAFSADGTGRVHSGTNPAARADARRRVPEWLKR